MWRLNGKGFTLVEIMIVVAIIGLLAAIAIPNFMAARTTAHGQACNANVRVLQGAYEMHIIQGGTAWAADDADILSTGNSKIAQLNTYLRTAASDIDCGVDATAKYKFTSATGLIECDKGSH